MSKKHNIIAILEDIRSAHNVGAMFRTSEGAGISELILTGITPYPPHNRIPKTALGSIENVNWKHNPDKQSVYEDLKLKNIPLVVIEINNKSKPYTEYSFTEPIAVVFGNEIQGVSELATSYADATLHVPMFGKKESLNVATVFGIIIYEIIRQYHA
ncbi:TrmH family RNA methyltransferase [Candidatus Dojkabacteria bacterium]|uniref:TrmH family RNA methyltransferase n=1 Tax=Candidatus Dojkabacteria bacterium TaxID=2099670 RepID=A0A952AG72_9BACT|nr:TrmH family RNA methyltransferase [Candidatus Dojkabacteria bacterium]